jgi:hypothetical protein
MFSYVFFRVFFFLPLISGGPTSLDRLVSRTLLDFHLSEGPVFGEHVQDHMLVGLGNPGGELGLYPAARFADVGVMWCVKYHWMRHSTAVILVLVSWMDDEN